MSVNQVRAKFGFSKGAVVQEYCFDEDVESTLREAIEIETGETLVDEDYGDVVDGAIVWWRADDGEVEDLTDLLVDAAANLDNGGIIWVLSPKAGEALHVEPFVIAEAAKVAGLSSTSNASLGGQWAGTRLMARPRK